MTQAVPAAALRTARDRLLALSTNYDEAVATFSWPEVGPTFNFAYDWFDAIARGNHAPGLVIVEEDQSRASYSFDELTAVVDHEPLWKVHQSVFAVLALESEPVDPRL